MNEDEITRFIVDLEGVETATANGDTFFFHGAERMFPFVTLVMSNFNDSYSDLDRPGVFRLNIGVTRQTFRALFGAPGARDADPADSAGTGYDFTALDTLLPHPVYGRQYWLCILNPGPATFAERVVPLLTEAHELATGKRSRRAE
ncbi:MAG TPA: DUF6194 family protein [Herpetosiphonaceae bacterium]|nr:DUF6194 family protein [Herpetosiphonaceae bacterium]